MHQGRGDGLAGYVRGPLAGPAAMSGPYGFLIETIRKTSGPVYCY